MIRRAENVAYESLANSRHFRAGDENNKINDCFRSCIFRQYGVTQKILYLTLHSYFSLWRVTQRLT